MMVIYIHVGSNRSKILQKKKKVAEGGHFSLKLPMCQQGKATKYVILK